MTKKDGKPILCLDFDGVIHWYRNGWKGADIIDDIPVPGAQQFVLHAKDFFRVIIFSSRSHQAGGIEAMRNWMRQHGFPEVEFTKEKPQAFISIDDHAITFCGYWPEISELLNFKPWYEGS